MADILIQFHALPEELCSLVLDAISEQEAHVTVFKFNPFSAAAATRDSLEQLLRDPAVREIAFTLEKSLLPVTSTVDFSKRHPNALLLTIGHHLPDGLAESSLACRTSDERALKVWKLVASRLRRMTKAGAVAINMSTGASAILRNHRYSVGARALDEAGVAIRPVAGTAILHLGLPASPST